jgi:transposase
LPLSSSSTAASNPSKERFGGITEAGNGYLRQMLMVDAVAAIRYAQRNSNRPWLVQVMGRRPTKVAAIELANKTARTAWALMTSGSKSTAIQATGSATPKCLTQKVGRC